MAAIAARNSEDTEVDGLEEITSRLVACRTAFLKESASRSYVCDAKRY